MPKADLPITIYEQVSSDMTNILLKAPEWINRNKENGLYYIENPSYPGENFAKKWNTHPERATVFFNWVKQATADLTGKQLCQMSRVNMGENIKRCFGEKTGKTVFSKAAEECRAGVEKRVEDEA